MPSYRDEGKGSNDLLLDKRLPPYQDIPDGLPKGARVECMNVESNLSPPDPAHSTKNLASSEIYTQFQKYSHDVDALHSLVNEQALYPPTYYVQIHGKHNETQYDSNSKESQKEVTDFYFRINITHLLGPRGSGEIQFLTDNKRGYRGTRYPSLKPKLSDWESRDALFEWCQKYVSDTAMIKSFALSRKIQNHDTKKLYRLIRSTIIETNYRGQVFITFPSTHSKLIVYSPGKINEWRTKTWIRWIFYITFLWVLAWPMLIFLTSRYETVNCVFFYANTSDSSDPNRTCKVQSEDEWFESWKQAIKRAVLNGINIGEQGSLSDNYRIASQTLFRDNHAIRSGNRLVDEANIFDSNTPEVTRDLVYDWGGDN
ncbi:hypothetical protein EV44_g5443 [Erysiphe necator]|uniref:Abc transporter protein n=1 Tax=Uncinula necator TaxID=52586 RepID=A0A0B1P298_UNCNE|nr:hypothetical protein EV44_g5443 [Erysiphe necator]